MFGLDLDKLQQEAEQLQSSIIALNLLLPELVKELKRLNENLEKMPPKTGL